MAQFADIQSPTPTIDDSLLRFRVLQPDPERLAYFPSVAQGPHRPFRHSPALPSIQEIESDSSDDDGGRDAYSATSTAPSRNWGDWN